MVKSNNVPVDFLCPITKEIMEDPVVASDGYTYERIAYGLKEAILRLWLEKILEIKNLLKTTVSVLRYLNI
ncbi:unnamed protein product [Blepharisma stoltei]|uniref:U-box domain-containing protein n=1 Tax=Blepharisma stoltei TaxID=1481888 RepID=A0AAU9J1D9_9CILI|nr:unnamed protein product [Blepharisma stoltei]